MPTKAHIKQRQSLGYLMQHLGDAPGYKVWVEQNWNSYESNQLFLAEVIQSLELTPQEMWLSHLACYNLLEKMISDTSKVTRVEVIDSNSRAYTNYHCKNVHVDFQDNDRTIKVFLKNNKDDNQTLKNT